MTKTVHCQESRMLEMSISRICLVSVTVLLASSAALAQEKHSLIPGQSITVNGATIECQLAPEDDYSQYLTLNDDALYKLSRAGKTGKCVLWEGYTGASQESYDYNGSLYGVRLMVDGRNLGANFSNENEFPPNDLNHLAKSRKKLTGKLRDFIKSGLCNSTRMDSSRENSNAQSAVPMN